MAEGEQGTIEKLATESPLLRGLLETLPPLGTDWPVAKRARWLSVLAGCFEQIYDGEGELTITAASSRAPGAR